MSNLFTLLSFAFFTALVGVITWWKSRGEDVSTNSGFFLAGRSLTFPFIAASLLLTNLSTEQLVGLNGQAYTTGLAVMVWEVVAVIALVFMALIFLPRFLKSGIATLPEFLDIRFGSSTQLICNLLFLIAYMVQLLPIILYTGAVGMGGILDVQRITGIESPTVVLWTLIWLIGIIDDKIGTKKTMVGFGVWYAIALLCNFGAADSSSPLVYVSLFMIAMGIGGSANFTTSLPASIFGRHGFDKVNSVIFPIQGAITALCFLVNGAVQLMTGGQIKMAYLVFAGVALVNVVLVLIINEHRFNRDWKAAHPGK